MRALKIGALKMVLGGVIIVGGWFVYTQVIPGVVQRAFEPLAVRHVSPPSSPSQSSLPLVPTRILSAPVVSGPTQQELAEKRRAELQAAADLQRQKDHAWLAYYSAPASCEHPVDWKAQVECGNQYMRAKKEFEEQWLVKHGTSESSGAAIVLDNESIAGSRK
jgi:hypothetical protein